MQWNLCFMCLTGATLLANCVSEYVMLNGTTSQSSVYKGLTASGAIDGSRTHCAHTAKQLNPWWRIDLQGIYSITSVTIYNKGNVNDNTCLNGAKILVGNSRKDNSTTNNECCTIANFDIERENIYHCGPLEGRYVTVHFNDTSEKLLILCDVQINGTKIESPVKLFNKNKTWEEAVGYCRRECSEKCEDIISIPDEQTQAFAELEAMKADTPFVWLGLRYTCVLDLWFWLSYQSIDFEHWAPGHRTTTECDMSGAMAKTEDHLWVSRPDSEKFNFICAI